MAEGIRNYRVIVGLTIFATIMPLLDSTIANVALPHMQGSLATTQDQIAWVLTSYIVASAIMTPATSWLAGRFGARQLFCISIALFTLMSGLCGIATTLEEMIVFRVLQGLSGAPLIPLSQSVLLEITPREKHGQVMSWWSLGVVSAPIIGPTLGGYLSEYYNWRWVFYINLPLGILTFIGLFTFLPDLERHQRIFDKFGFIVLSVAIGSLQLLLDRGQGEDWFSSTEIVIYAALMLAGMWMFVMHTRRAKNPFVSLELFTDRNFVTCLLFSFFVGFVLFSTVALMAPYMQHLMGYPVLRVGELLVSRGVGVVVSTLIIGRLIGRIDSRIAIFIGLLLTAYSLWEMTHFSAFVPEHIIFRVGVVQGLGIGLVFVPLSTLAYTTLAPQLRTEATSFYNLLRNMGGSIGISSAVALLGVGIQTNHSYIGELVTPQTTGMATHYLPPPFNQSSTVVLSLMDAEINRQAAAIAYVNDFKVMMWIVLACVPFIILLRNENRTRAKTSPPASEPVEPVS